MKKSMAAASACAAALLLAAPATASAAEPAARPAERTAVVQSDASATAAAATCNLKLSKPWKENRARTGITNYSRGTYQTVNNCSGFTLGATLQYHRWHGWSGLASASWVGNRSVRTLEWKCQGKGTFTYRMFGTVRGGSNGEEPRVGRGSGPQNRFTC
ncbi:hypothetical protein AB0E83_07560 [Streptomyces sp. NPDC035033]|uniref:hypothetical protein n=1 Tax=Streptomyces sp. NPDC035033 TaxID=3155368 RepID=UPI0033EEF889